MSDADEEDIFGYTTAPYSEADEAEKRWAELVRSAAMAKQASAEPYTVTRRTVRVQQYDSDDEGEDMFGFPKSIVGYGTLERRAQAAEAAEAEEQWRQLVQGQKRQARKFTGRSPVTAPFFRPSALPMTEVYAQTIQELQAEQSKPGKSAAELAALRAQEQVYRRELSSLRAQEAAHRERMAAAAMKGGKKAYKSQQRSIRKLHKSMRKSIKALKKSLKRGHRYRK